LSSTVAQVLKRLKSLADNMLNEYLSCLEFLSVEVEVVFNITLGISSFVMCDAAYWLIDEILHGEYYVSIKVICYLCLFASSLILSIECQRGRSDIVFVLLLNVSSF
jgi:hypothetical protein